MVPPVRAIATRTCRDRWPGRALRRTHISTIARDINALVDVAQPSWPGLSGPPIAAQVVEIKGTIRPFLDVGLCSIHLRHEMCVRLRDKPGHDDVGTFPA